MSKAGISNSIITCNQKGFTLAELAIVVLLIALMSALSIPLLGHVGDADLNRAGRRLAGSVKYLYNESALEGLPFRLQFDLDSNRITAQQQRLENGEWEEVTGRYKPASLPGSVRMHRIRVEGQGTISSGTAEMIIHPVGWLDETTLHLIDGERKMTLWFSPLTGTAEFYDGHRELP